MKFIKHYLEDVRCPINREYACDSRCVWFDNEEEDCRMIGGILKIRDSLNYIRETVEYIDKGVNKR